MMMMMMMMMTWQEEESWFFSSQDLVSFVFLRLDLSTLPAVCLFACYQTNSRSPVFVCFGRNSRCLFVFLKTDFRRSFAAAAVWRRGTLLQRQLPDYNSRWCWDHSDYSQFHPCSHCNHCNHQAPLCSGNRWLSWYWYCNHCNHFYSQRPPRFDY